MKLKQYQVDAFAEKVFEGNPAAVCPLSDWLDDDLLQSIAEENNLSETVFFVPVDDGFELRWFTPVAEVDLCGHATLAAAHIIFEQLNYAEPVISFQTRSGLLTVQREDGRLLMNFPVANPAQVQISDDLVAALGVQPLEVWAADDYVAVLGSEQAVRDLQPDFAQMMRLDRRGVIVTAVGENTDIVTRFFAPRLGVNEDPVTGSAHCELMPLWVEKLGKHALVSRQVSKRGGTVYCQLQDDRVLLSGSAVTFMAAEIWI